MNAMPTISPLRGLKRFALGILGCTIVFLGAAVVNSDEESLADKALLGITQEWIKLGRLSDALERLDSEKEASPDIIARCRFGLSQAYFDKGDYHASLTQLETIIERHPKSSVAPLAWLGKGEVYEKLGDEKRMVETLERVIEAPRVETKLGIMDASDTRNRAYELLGGHYVRSRQWEKALQAYSQWKPRSWCGNCFAAMELRRKNSLLLCLVHTGRHAEAADTAWQSVAAGDTLAGSAGWQMSAFVLIRLYEEAGQREDLVRILDELAPPVLALKAGKNMVAAAVPPAGHRRESAASEMRYALRLVHGASDAARIDAFLAKPSENDREHFSGLSRPVAAWLLVRDRPKSVTQVVAAARKGRHDMVALSEVLAAIDSPAARSALVTVAVKAGREHRHEVIAVIRAHCSKPDEVIARIAKSARLDESAEYAPRFPDRGYFFAAWPKPEPGSLPKKPPASVLNPKGG